jgi:hypothetical protein
MWGITYLVIIYRMRRYQFVDMPVIAGAGNFAWEILWTFGALIAGRNLFVTNMGSIVQWAYHAWFILDVYIVWYLFRFGHKQGWSPFITRHFKGFFIITVAVMGLLFYNYTVQTGDLIIGAITAYADNMVMSFLYIFMLWRLTDVRGLSPWVAWTKMLGTGTNTIFMFLHFPEERFLHTMGVLLWLADMTYIFMLHYRRNRQTSPALSSHEPVGMPDWGGVKTAEG